jgi:hypothetical protein
VPNLRPSQRLIFVPHLQPELLYGLRYFCPTSMKPGRKSSVPVTRPGQEGQPRMNTPGAGHYQPVFAITH